MARKWSKTRTSCVAWGAAAFCAFVLLVFGITQLYSNASNSHGESALSELPDSSVLQNQPKQNLDLHEQRRLQHQPPQQPIAELPAIHSNVFTPTDELFGQLIRQAMQGQAKVEKERVEPEKSKYYRACVLLTNTVHVNIDLRKTGFGKNQQRDPKERKDMYIGVLSHYLKAFPDLPVTIVENSGDDMCWAEETASSLHRPAINGSCRTTMPPSPNSRLDPMKQLSIVRVQQPKVCMIPGEIGCSEAHSVTVAIQQSPHFNPKTKGYCTHAVKVTGRFAVTSDFPKILTDCGKNWVMAVQNPTWRKINLKGKSRQETQAIGFDIAYTQDMFGWWKNRGMCQECHQTPRVQKMRECIGNGTLPADTLCDFPSMNILPVGEGSTGIKRTSI